MIQYTERFKSGFPVVDAVVCQNWELVIDYIQRAEDWQKSTLKEKYRPWSDLDKQFSALSCIGDLVSAMVKVITKEDILVRSSIIVYNGGLEGDIVIDRDGQEFTISTKSVSAGGYNIQSFHYRYLIKSSLPKLKVPKDALELITKERSRLSTIEFKKKNLERYKSELSEALIKREQQELESREECDKRIYEIELELYKKGIIEAPFTVYWLDNRDKEEFSTFEEYISKRCENAWIAGRSILNSAIENIQKYTRLIEETQKIIEELQK